MTIEEIYEDYTQLNKFDPVNIVKDINEELRYALNQTESTVSFGVKENLAKLEDPDGFWKKFKWDISRRLFSNLKDKDFRTIFDLDEIRGEKFSTFKGDDFSLFKHAENEGRLSELLSALHSKKLYRAYLAKNNEGNELLEFKMNERLNKLLLSKNILEENFSKSIEEKISTLVDNSTTFFQVISTEILVLAPSKKDLKESMQIGPIEDFLKKYGVIEDKGPFIEFDDSSLKRGYSVHAGALLVDADLSNLPRFTGHKSERLPDLDTELIHENITNFIRKHKAKKGKEEVITKAQVIDAQTRANQLFSDFSKQELDKFNSQMKTFKKSLVNLKNDTHAKPGI